MKRKSNNVLRNKRRCSKFSRTLKQELGYSHWRYLIERELSAISYMVYHVQTSSGVSCYRAWEFLFFFLRHFPTESFFVVGVSAAFVHNQEWQQQWLDFDCRQLLRASGVFIFFTTDACRHMYTNSCTGLLFFFFSDERASKQKIKLLQHRSFETRQKNATHFLFFFLGLERKTKKREGNGSMGLGSSATQNIRAWPARKCLCHACGIICSCKKKKHIVLFFSFFPVFFFVMKVFW